MLKRELAFISCDLKTSVGIWGVGDYGFEPQTLCL